MVLVPRRAEYSQGCIQLLIVNTRTSLSMMYIPSATTFSISGAAGRYSIGISGQTRSCGVLISGAPGPTTASYEAVPPKRRSMTYLGPFCSLILKTSIEKDADERVLKNICGHVASLYTVFAYSYGRQLLAQTGVLIPESIKIDKLRRKLQAG